jgi:hypothetical protein
LINTIDIEPEDKTFILVSSNEKISKSKRRLLGAELEDSMRVPLTSGGPSLNELTVTGLLELCKVKPVGMDAVRWLGEWYLANNPLKPNVESPDD